MLFFPVSFSLYVFCSSQQYYRGEERDEKTHARIHDKFLNGVKFSVCCFSNVRCCSRFDFWTVYFQGWQKEDVVFTSSTDRIICVKPDIPNGHLQKVSLVFFSLWKILL
jgi:hypothetical protein